MAINYVDYARGLRENYDAIPTKDENTIYFCEDTGEIFLGDYQMSSIAEIDKLKTALSELKDDVGTISLLEFEADSVVDALNKLSKKSAGITENITVSNDIGRYKTGDVIAANTPLDTIFKGLFQKVSVPTLTAPKATVNVSVPSLAKVGSTVNFGNVTVTFSRGSISPAYGTDGYRAGTATKYGVIVESGSTALYSQEGASNSFSVGNITIQGKGVVTISGTVSYGAGQQPKDSDGNDYGEALAAGTVSDRKTAVEFILPFMYGGTDGVSFTGLTEDLTKKGAKNYTVTTNSNKVTFLYDASYGNLKSILDANNFENIDGFTKSTVTIDGQQYNAYVSQFDTNGSAAYKLSF